jgi:hypothetical protein
VKGILSNFTTLIKKLKMSDFKDFSKKATQNQNDSDPKPNEDKVEKPVQPSESEDSSPIKNNEEKNK